MDKNPDNIELNEAMKKKCEISPVTDYTHVKKKGKRGKQIRLITNYVRVFVDNKDGIFGYTATFYPPLKNFDIQKKFLAQFENVLKEQRIFDGTHLFLPFQLPEEIMVFKGVHPNHPNVVITATLKANQRPYRESVQFFNVLFRRIMTVLGKFEYRRNFFDDDIKFKLPQYKLEIWPGICTSVEEQEDGLMLCLDTSYRVFKTDTVYDYICALNDSTHWEQKFKDYILGKVVVTQYNHFTYKIDDIDWCGSPLSTFEHCGKQITYVEYYKKQYNIEIRDQNQPLLLSRVHVKNKYKETEQVKIISIVPEICFVCGMNDEDRNDQNVVKEVRRYTYTTPAQKLKALSAFISRATEIEEAKNILETWKVRMDNKLLSVDGRELPAPILHFKDRTSVQQTEPIFEIVPKDGIYDAVPLGRWLIICSERDVKIVNRFMEHYARFCNSTGIKSSNSGPQIVTLKSVDPRDFQETLEDYADPGRFQFVVVVMPFFRREIYSLIKRVCCSEKFIPSQVIMAKTLADKGNYDSSVKNIAIQINCKLGGSPWGLYIPLAERIMFIGIDVNHDVRKVLPSAVALIASLNNSCTKFFSRVHVQRIHQEITDNMQPLFSEALECYAETNGTYPDRVIVFRDGGSLSYMHVLIEHEVQPMLASIKTLCPDLKNFTYTVVSKRVPQRFFVEKTRGMFGNPNPGTVVDNSITYPNMFDFYVVSQQKSQGAVNPTHYMVIYDRGGIKADLLQQLAYSTTFMYFNWCGAIRVPAMIQYAHKLSSLVGQNLRGVPSSRMDKLLYYL